MSRIAEIWQRARQAGLAAAFQPTPDQVLALLVASQFPDDYIEFRRLCGWGELTVSDFPTYFLDFFEKPLTAAECYIDNPENLTELEGLVMIAATIDGNFFAFRNSQPKGVYHVSVGGEFIFEEHGTFAECLAAEIDKIIGGQTGQVPV